MKEYRLNSDSNEKSLQRIEELMNSIPNVLRKIPEEEFSKKPAPNKWSKKEIIGHLIDSATNNHHRFVRGQFEDAPTILYDQEQWNNHGYYNLLNGKHLISFWELYNRHLIELIHHIPKEQMSKECRMSDGSTRTISWLFDDYVRHLEHHLGQIF